MFKIRWENDWLSARGVILKQLFTVDIARFLIITKFFKLTLVDADAHCGKQDITHVESYLIIFPGFPKKYL
ncbi:hypothetical protein JW935_21075 [candidate division KSB1 bacterium]|nr:hypothetical protein [candidate division KSB1 bacterium]